MKTCIRSNRRCHTDPTRRRPRPAVALRVYHPSRGRAPEENLSLRLSARVLSRRPRFSPKTAGDRALSDVVRCMHLGGAVARPLRMIGAMSPAMIAARGVAASAASTAPARAAASAPGVTPGAAGLASRAVAPAASAPTRRPLRRRPLLRAASRPISADSKSACPTRTPVPSSTQGGERDGRLRQLLLPRAAPRSRPRRPAQRPHHTPSKPYQQTLRRSFTSAASVCTRAWWRRCASAPRAPTRAAISSESPREQSPNPPTTTPRVAPSPVAGSRTRRPKTCCSSSCAA